MTIIRSVVERAMSHLLYGVKDIKWQLCKINETNEQTNTCHLSVLSYILRIFQEYNIAINQFFSI